MSSLQNLQISQTFPGLIKTNDELAIDATLKTLQDGAGNDLPMQVSNSTINFTGTVTGIPGATDTLYDLAAVDGTAPIPGRTAVDINLVGSDATTDTVKLWEGDNIYLTRSGNQIEIGTPTPVQNLNNLTGGLTLIGGTNVTITDDGGSNITIDATGGGGGTDTTYDLTKSYIGSALSINLVGSDATTDSVGISPGTGIAFAQTTAGIQISATGGGGGAGLYNTSYMPRFRPTMYGNYGAATNFMVSQPLNGDITWQNAIDGNSATTIFGVFYARPDTTVTEIAFATANTTIEQDYTVVFYDSYPDGSPRDLISTNVITVPFVANDRWYTHTLSTPLSIVAGNEYWFGIKTDYSTGSIRNTVGRNSISNPVGTIINLTNPNEGFLGNNSLYWNQPLPSTFLTTDTFGTRDEAIILMYR